METMTTTNSNMPTTINAKWGADSSEEYEVETGRIKLMQALSQGVKDEKFKVGEIVNLSNDRVVGGRGKPFEVLLFGKVFRWVVYEKDENGESKFKETFLMTASNAGLPWKSDDGKIKRVPSLEFFAIPANNLKARAFVIPWSGSSFKHAKKLNAVTLDSPKSLGGYVYSFDSIMEKHKTFSYYVYTFKQVRESTLEEEMVVKSKFDKLEEYKAKAIESFEADDEGSAH